MRTSFLQILRLILAFSLAVPQLHAAPSTPAPSDNDALTPVLSEVQQFVMAFNASNQVYLLANEDVD